MVDMVQAQAKQRNVNRKDSESVKQLSNVTKITVRWRFYTAIFTECSSLAL